MSSEYPPEVYGLLEWFAENPMGRWEDVPRPLIDYGWDFVKRDDLHDNCHTMEIVPGLSGFGRNVLREDRQRTPEAESGKQQSEPASATATSLDARALALFVEDQTRTKTVIARILGKKSTQSICPARCPKLDAAMTAWRSRDPSQRVRRVSKDAEGNLEAWDDA